MLHQNNSLFSSRFSPPAKDATLRYLQKFSNEVKILTVKTSEDKDCKEEEMENAAIEYQYAFFSTLPKLVRQNVGGTICDKNPVLRIHYILGWIRIRILGSMPLTNGSRFGSGSGSWIRILLFLSLTFKMPAKNLFFNAIFSAYYFLKLNLYHFSKIKSQKE